MIRNIFTSGFMIMLLYIPALADDSNAGGQNINTLPWEIIAEKFDAKEPFCTAKSKDVNNINTIAEGFYNLSLNYDKNDVSKENNNFYAVIAADWKKDLLEWCRKNKEQIETNPDSQLIYSSIAVSHFDNLMELASKSQSLSENILSALSKAIKAKIDFENGNCPDIVKGLNKIRLKRFEGASISQFVMVVPEAYDNSKKWPMLVYVGPNLFGLGDDYKQSSSIINLLWRFPVPLGYEWKDYKLFLNIISDKINLDKDRIYIKGECLDGIASIDIALKYPDQWAECSASLGNSSRHLTGNALNLPLIFVKGNHNPNYLIAYYDFAVECFKYNGCRFFRHSKSLNTERVRGSPVPIEIRNLSPYRVFYTTESLANPSAYWVQIDGRGDENFIASIDANICGQSILLKTKNVDAYTLNLELAPVDCNRPVEIIENSNSLDSVTGPVFVRKSPKYENALYVKNKSLHGPVSDVFTDRYAVVWQGDESTKRLGEELAGSGTCFADVNLPADFVNTHNIIFVGRLDKSEHFAQIADKLPVIIEDGRLTANGRSYEGDFGAIFVYPNPLNPQKYLAIFSGSTDKAMGLLDSVWGQIKSNDNADIGIFEASENNRIDWLICEKLNTVWGWHKSWDVPLAKLIKTYPKWKWHQWIASVLREQLKADVMILEDPFNSVELPDTGELTLRDISRIIKNDWIVKISLKGNDLRELLRVSFNDISSREILAPVIDGVTFLKQPADGNVICINELENNRFYTVALPYKAVNGKRMGIVMKNYRLESEGFMVVLLNEYLKQNTGIDLDSELSLIKLNIF